MKSLPQTGCVAWDTVHFFSSRSSPAWDGTSPSPASRQRRWAAAPRGARSTPQGARWATRAVRCSDPRRPKPTGFFRGWETGLPSRRLILPGFGILWPCFIPHTVLLWRSMMFAARAGRSRRPQEIRNTLHLFQLLFRPLWTSKKRRLPDAPPIRTWSGTE